MVKLFDNRNCTCCQIIIQLLKFYHWYNILLFFILTDLLLTLLDAFPSVKRTVSINSLYPAQFMTSHKHEDAINQANWW